MEEHADYLKALAVHYVGNGHQKEMLNLSSQPVELDDLSMTVLQDGFLKRFRNNTEYYSFTHPSSLLYNEVYQFCLQLFSGGDLIEISQAIARHLYAQSEHPRIRGGELYVALFEGLPVESRVQKAIGIFKAESKSFFLDVQQRKGKLQIDLKEGVEPSKIDKGCLVIQHQQEDGFDVLIFDQQNRSEEAQYWKEKFLGLAPRQNEFHHTSHLLSLTKQFITGPLQAEQKIDKTEQVELLHRSLDYFKSHDSFDIEEFQKEVFSSEDRIDSFRRFGTQYVENSDFDIASQFDISADAVKKQSRIYKSVIKLDRNFHIYVHGRTDLIEKGMDMDGRKYYKIYFQEEN